MELIGKTSHFTLVNSNPVAQAIFLCTCVPVCVCMYNYCIFIELPIYDELQFTIQSLKYSNEI